jgi:glycosyltransferase involved in cell wall biosynthesis
MGREGVPQPRLVKEGEKMAGKAPLSIVILTFNSEEYLPLVLESASFADEILIYDQGSRDRTLEIARQFPNTTIYQDPNWEGFGEQKQKGVDRARNRWVFVLDSDEVITPQLAEELQSLLPNPPKKGYYVPRLNYFFGKWVRYGGFYPDFTLRFFDKTACQFDRRIVHEKVVCPSKEIGYLSGDICHFAYRNITQFIEKQNRYSGEGSKFNRLKAIFAPLWTFIKIYFLRLGFLEGWTGFLLAKLYSQYTFWKYAKGACPEEHPPLPPHFHRKNSKRG